MSSWNCRMKQERQKREKHLQQRVQETLRLSPPDLPTEECPTHTPTPEERKAAARQYRNKLRTNRILQVRAQEAVFASQRLSQFRDRKAENSKMLLNHLKDVWRNDQVRCISSLKEEFAKSCKSIGVGHEVALLLERNRAAKKESAARQAEESRYWDTLRFEEAMHKERELKELRERAECAPRLRRQVVESASSIERSFARRYNRGAKPKPKPPQTGAYGCFQTVKPLVNHDVIQDKLSSKLAGCPIDFKDTNLHPRFDAQHGRANCPSAVVSCPEQKEIDAGRAADARRESINCEKANRLLSERQPQRGNAPTAKVLND